MSGPAIIDTNIVVAGLLTARSEAPVARILDAMLDAAFPFVLSEALLAEYSQVTRRPRLRARHGLDDPQIDLLMLELAQHAIVLQPDPATRIAPDAGDQHLWDLLFARDDLILVTGDKALIESLDTEGRVISPYVFVEDLLNRRGVRT